MRRKMFHQERLYFVILLLCSVLVLSNKTTHTHGVRCSLRCAKPKLRQGEIYSKCHVSYPLKLNCSAEEFSLQLQNVSFMDLSDNQLTWVPSSMFPSCKNLTILSLANNSITDIEPGAFTELRNLKTLNLSFNNLREWTVDHKNELQSLNALDVTGNKAWLPSKQSVLHLKNLRTVQGVTWTKYCKTCLLLSSTEINSSYESSCGRYSRIRSPISWPWHEEIQYGRALDFIKVGFWPECLCDGACYGHQHKLPYYRALYDVVLKAKFSLYATGSVALLVNITVVLVIVCNKSLRTDIAVVLICHIAVCDVLIAIYSVLYVTFNFYKTFIDYEEQRVEENHHDGLSKMKNLANITGPMFTYAVASQVFGSFVLTLEKFLKIVFAMKPNIRIGRRGVFLSLILFFLLSVTFAVLPVFDVAHMTYLPDGNLGISVPTDQRIKVNGKVMIPVGIAAGVQLVLIIIQLTSFLLYLPIFIVAKRSGANVGIKREAAIAKKIALLVFSNLIFFTFPLVLGVFGQKLFYDVVQRVFPSWQNLSLTKAQWILFGLFALPILCVSINSILNPFLVALRHPKIKRELRQIFIRCRIVLSESSAALVQHLHCHTNTVQPENDEMQDVN